MHFKMSTITTNKVTISIINHHVVGLHGNIAGNRNRHVPKVLVITTIISLQAGKLLKVVDHR